MTYFNYVGSISFRLSNKVYIINSFLKEILYDFFNFLCSHGLFLVFS